MDRSGQFRLYEDLPVALRDRGGPNRDRSGQRWRIHFHVPLFCDRLGGLHTTQAEIGKCLSAIQRLGRASAVAGPAHFELETYAWEVLPDTQVSSLAEGLAREFRWFDEQIQ